MTDDAELFDALARALAESGPATALDQLADRLQAARAFTDLFYAKLTAARLKLGVTPVPTAPSADLPESAQEAYESAIRAAAREVGRLCLDVGDIPKAFGFFRLIGETEPVRAALDDYNPGPDDDIQDVLAVAVEHGVHPRRGFDLVLERQGVCSAISLVGGYDSVLSPADKDYCVRALTRALYSQVTERVRAEVEAREGPTAPAELDELTAGRDWVFDDESYFVDVTHLYAVVQMSLQLDGGGEPRLARMLCAFGERLPERFRHRGDVPFEDTYRDFAHYLAALAGDDVERHVAHFRAKLPEPDDDGSTYPAEVLVTLLWRVGRPAEALAVARRHLVHADDRRLSCPGVYELCRRCGDYAALAECARARGDAVHFLAALLANRAV